MENIIDLIAGKNLSHEDLKQLALHLLEKKRYDIASDILLYISKSNIDLQVIRDTPIALCGRGEFDRARQCLGSFLDLLVKAVTDKQTTHLYFDVTPEEKAALEPLQSLIAGTYASLISTYRATEYIIDNRIPGDLVECGVFKGASVIAMIKCLLAKGNFERDLWLYDTFKGMPKPDEVDVAYNGQNIDTWYQKRKEDGSSTWVNASEHEVMQNVLSLGYPKDKIHFVKGLVEDTIPSYMPQRISLLRLDTDFYRSTKHELIHLYPRLLEGGLLIVDDYGAWAGARKAVNEYISENNLRLYLARVDGSVRVAVKQGAFSHQTLAHM